MSEAGQEPDSNLMHRCRYWNRCILLSATGLCLVVALAAVLYIRKMLDMLAVLSGGSAQPVEEELAGDLSVLGSWLTAALAGIARLVCSAIAPSGRCRLHGRRHLSVDLSRRHLQVDDDELPRRVTVS